MPRQNKILYFFFVIYSGLRRRVHFAFVFVFSPVFFFSSLSLIYSCFVFVCTMTLIYAITSLSSFACVVNCNCWNVVLKEIITISGFSLRHLKNYKFFIFLLKISNFLFIHEVTLFRVQHNVIQNANITGNVKWENSSVLDVRFNK